MNDITSFPDHPEVDSGIRTNENDIQKLLKSSDVDKTQMDAKLWNSRNGDNEKNPKYQEGVNSYENIPTEQFDKSPKSGSNNIPKELFPLDPLGSSKVAVEQFAAATLSKGPNESPIKDLTMLQSTLFTLQHQQVFQMQLIEQLQYQLAKTNSKREKRRTISQTKLKKEDKTEPDPKADALPDKSVALMTEWQVPFL